MLIVVLFLPLQSGEEHAVVARGAGGVVASGGSGDRRGRWRRCGGPGRCGGDDGGDGGGGGAPQRGDRGSGGAHPLDADGASAEASALEGARFRAGGHARPLPTDGSPFAAALPSRHTIASKNGQHGQELHTPRLVTPLENLLTADDL